MKLITHYRSAHHFLGVTYPDGNRKQDRMISIAMSPVHTCPADAPCRKENGGSCYYQAEEGYFPSVAKSAAKNYEVWRNDPERFWKSYRKACEYAVHENIGLRNFEGGDIPSYEFFCKLMEFAEEFPGLMHGMTKKYWIVNKYIAEHGGDTSCVLKYYHLQYSSWPGYPMVNPYGMPVYGLTYEEKETTCLEQKLKMIGKEWSCSDCYKHHCGCYASDHRSINCIDHATERKIIAKRGLWKKTRKENAK